MLAVIGDIAVITILFVFVVSFFPNSRIVKYICEHKWIQVVLPIIMLFGFLYTILNMH